MSIMEMELKKPFISLTGSCFATKRLFTLISIAIFFVIVVVLTNFQSSPWLHHFFVVRWSASL